MNTEDPHTETLIPLQKHLFDIPSEITYLNCCYMSPQLLSAVSYTHLTLPTICSV